mmetsp:Transcript_83097/g.240499  ORF Transcript_83097/g.240499 Transcript_83097/m.240499 type:complete len:113 (+) Transcript_83097:44-382(+)
MAPREATRSSASSSSSEPRSDAHAMEGVEKDCSTPGADTAWNGEAQNGEASPGQSADDEDAAPAGEAAQVAAEEAEPPAVLRGEAAGAAWPDFTSCSENSKPNSVPLSVVCK